MKPVLGTEALRAAEASSGVAVQTLIARAGYAVAQAALAMVESVSGKRITVLAGPGNNGADGRVAAQHLQAAGAAVTVIPADDLPGDIAPCDLIIDALFGTGFHGSWKVPTVHSPVLAVDVPTGVDGDTGAGSCALPATRTIPMIAHKPGLLFDPGFTLAGEVQVADLGIAVPDSDCWLVDSLHHFYAAVPSRDRHKWTRAVTAVCGSPGMTGAADLVARAAMRSGAGMVRLCAPGVDPAAWPPGEVVVEPVASVDWAQDVLRIAERTQVLVIGPGLGRSDNITQAVRMLVDRFDGTMIVDGDGLHALAGHRPSTRGTLIVTPHDGEYRALTGSAPSTDRRADARSLAKSLGAVVLLKGSTTVVSNTERELLIVQDDGRLGTAGTGDVLAGILAGMAAAQGRADDELVATAAFVHGEASRQASGRGLIASDLVHRLPAVFAAAQPATQPATQPGDSSHA